MLDLLLLLVLGFFGLMAGAIWLAISYAYLIIGLFVSVVVVRVTLEYLAGR